MIHPLSRTFATLATPSALSMAMVALLFGVPLLGSTSAFGASLDEAAPCGFDGNRSAVRYAVTSFGAEGVGADLYVFSGHVGRTHAHSLANLDPHFIRYGCDGTVEELPSGGAVQGTALVGFGPDVIAVGGLSARNATADEPEDLVSVATVRRFDTGSGQWLELPQLPQGRSSHDAVVLDGRLYVVGGWQLRGIDLDPVWISDMAVLDLRAEDPTWSSIAQPFRTRALAVTHDGSHLVVVGGMTDDDQTSAATHLFDVAAGAWHRGPDLPIARGLKGFGLAAEFHDGHAVVSPAGGSVYALSPSRANNVDARSWIPAAELEEPRFFHELAVVGGNLYAVAGTSRRAHLDSIEAVGPMERGAFAPLSADIASGHDSPRWAGFRRHARPAVRTDDELSERWRAELQGYGQSSPVIWASDDRRRVYLTTVDGPQLESQQLLALDLDTGASVWERSFDSTERFENSDMIARAASTPAVDTNGIYALFGSGDLVATDHDGNDVWRRDLATEFGSFGGNHGVGSSVVRTRDAVVVAIARKTYAYVLAVDPATGATRWRTERQAGPGWTTPVPVGEDILLVGGSGRLDALESATGNLLWTVEGLGGNNLSSPTVSWLPTEDGKPAFQIAVAATRTGGVSMLAGSDPRARPELIWQNDQTSHYSAPFFNGPCLLTSNGVGGLFCLDPTTGDELWRERLAGPVWAQPVHTSEQSVITISENGVVQILDATSGGPRVETTAELAIEGRVYGVAATADGLLVLRSGSTVVGLGIDDTH